MQNTENLDCCSPKSEPNCCDPNDEKNKNKGIKIKFGLGIFALAFILALTSAFKGVTTKEITCTTTSKVITSKNDFKWLKTDKEVTYLLLKGNDVSENEKINSKIENVVSELNNSDGSAYYLALEVNEENYLDVVSKLNIEVVPATVVLGKSALVVKESAINITTLIRAYETVLTSKMSCSSNQKVACSEKSKASCDKKTKASCTTQQKAACGSSNE
ncbi:hypothetical protein [uncultured Tenacibaculum sp.]|uniref:hypothetical protein n=1 Tax=uncultured Tenacibaculum sp. TaxID=174713 RepID=UPI00261D9629|nr:hypothetical protein [uncultured Tenacibaculum sp.]